jgi:putative transposase
MRCNNREFRLLRLDCRKVFLFALQRCREKFGFKLYGLCVMSNHVHYLLEPLAPEDLPKIMHWLNWYTAMCFNRMLNRTGHFWEKRYHCTGLTVGDHRRALNTLRYIHGNPKAAGMQRGFFDDFSNYGIYDRLSQDGITQWHPAFLALGTSLDLCAAAYRRFCLRYRPNPKLERPSTHWGSKLLKKIKVQGKPRKRKGPGQSSPWEGWDAPDEIDGVARTFVRANALNPEIALKLLDTQLELDLYGDNPGPE